MSPDQILDVINVIKVLGWVIAGLLAFIAAVGGFMLKRVYDAVITTEKDHEKVAEIYPMVHEHEKVLTKLQTEHGIFHAEKTKI